MPDGRPTLFTSRAIGWAEVRKNWIEAIESFYGARMRIYFLGIAGTAMGNAALC